MSLRNKLWLTAFLLLVPIVFLSMCYGLLLLMADPDAPPEPEPIEEYSDDTWHISFHFGYALFEHRQEAYLLSAPEIHPAIDKWFNETAAYDCDRVHSIGGHFPEDLTETHDRQRLGIHCWYGSKPNCTSGLKFNNITLSKIEAENQPRWVVNGWEEIELCEDTLTEFSKIGGWELPN